MNVRAFQGLRIVVGTLVLLGCGLVFADVRHWLSPRIADAFTWSQFLPSALAFIRGGGWAALGFAAVLVLTMLLGRIYCAMLCPLGVLMDAVAWIGRKRGKKRRLPYKKGLNWLRTVVVAATVGLAFAGSATLLGFLDPFSLFGRVVAGTVRPSAVWANNGMVYHNWIAATNVAKMVPNFPLAAGVAIGLLVLIVVMALKRGRLWCNTMCPVGAILGALSKFSLFRLVFAKDACTACSLCERSCPAQCIDYRNLRVDHSRCVMCLDCVSSCRKTGLHLEFAYGKSRSGKITQPESPAEPVPCPSSPPATRRGFLEAAGAVGAAAAAAAASKSKEGEWKLTPATKKAVLPPGAVSLAHFQGTCTACHLCVTHCPEQVLRPAITQHGLAGFLQPFQDFGFAFCSFNCSICSEVCPTGAIQPITVEQRQVVQAGIAKFFKERCVVEVNGTPCGACSEHCPTQAVHMIAYKNNLTIPEVTPELCVGCGGCEFICPVIPDKAIVVDGLAVHGVAQRIDTSGQNKVRKMDEEFPF